MSEEFFERLRERAIEKSKIQTFMDYCPARGIDATIEALEEMMVGEPIRAIIEHKFHQDSIKAEMDEDTMIVAHPFKFGCDAEIWFKDHHGIDGEEVVILAVRLS